MALTVQHSLTATTPDDPAYEIRPSHWNESHVIVGALIGAAAAGTQTATSGTLVFADSNGLTFGMSGSSQITASHNGLTTAALSDHSHGNPTLALTNLSGTTASNSAGLTLSLSAAAPGVGGGIAAAAGTQTGTSGTIVFANSNGITFGMSDSSQVTASHNGLTSQSNQALSGSNGSFTFQTATFGALNGLTFYTSNGSMVGSYTVPTQSVVPGIQSISAGTTRATTGEVIFSNSNGLSFGMDAGTVTGSYTVPTQSAQTLGLYAVSNTTGQSSSSTFDARTLSFHGAGVASVGYSGGSVVISVPAGGGGLTNVNLSAGTTSQNLSNFVFSNSNGVSFGLNGSTVTASVNAAGGGATISFLNPFLGAELITTTYGQNSIHFQPFVVPAELHMSRVVLPCNHSGATNSTGTQSITVRAGLYSLNGSTLSQIASATESYVINHSGTVNTTLYGSYRNMTIPLSTTVTPGNYWFAFGSSTSGTSNMGSLRNLCISQAASGFAGILGVGSATSAQYELGMGFKTSAGLPASVAITAISGTVAVNMKRPIFMLMGMTV